MSVQQQTIQFIPLNKLIVSPRNVRRQDRKADIDALAASIASRGLLQNLCVVPKEGERYEVDAGGRRLAALKVLVKTGVIPKDWPVPCNVVEAEHGREVSLTENVHRVAMDAMDEVDAYAALVEGGSTPDQVAQRFGVTRRHVDQRLALSGLSPKIKAGWKRGDVSLDAARAFCLVEDHGQQEAVYRSLRRPITHASNVRARLMEGRVRITDRLAVFVGLEAYEAGGGKILRDLFDADAVFIENPALLTKLAEEKLEASRASWLVQGWKWVDISLGGGRADGLSSKRLHPERRDPTEAEQAELDRLSGELEQLDAELDANAVEDDPRWSQRDDLEAAYETIRQAGRCWTPEAKEITGVVLSVDHDGAISATEGLVRTEDQKSVDAFLRQRRLLEAGADPSDDPATEDAPPSRTSALPKAVNRDLTLARTRALRLALSGDPDVALALCVAALAHRSFHHAEMPGIGVSASVRTVDDLPYLDVERTELEGRLPNDDIELLDWALDLSRERLLSVLALIVANSVELAHEDTTDADLRKQAIGDRLAQQLDVDMTQFWTAGIDFWGRLPKASLLAAFGESPGMSDRGERTRADLMKAHAKLRRDDLAAKVSDLYANTGYLPDILVTPVAAGGLVLTPDAVAELSHSAVAAE